MSVPALAVGAMLALVAEGQGAAPACPAAQVMPGPGVADPFHLPSAAAKQLNADALAFYRQGKWEEARQKYRAAEAADPEFLAPALNVACSYVRQERFAEAVSEVKRLLDAAYLPWSDELATAADLGALKIRPEGKGLRAILEEDRQKWAQGLSDDVLFVARTRAPLKLGAAPGVTGTFVLGPRQEVFAWSPRTRRYRQLTSEQGRVLLLARSRDGRRIAYATAEKLILTPGGPPRLRGLVVKEVDLGTLAVLGEARSSVDVGRIEILRAGSGFAYRMDPGAGRGMTYALRDGQLDPAPAPRTAKAVATMTGKGASSIASAPVPGTACSGNLADARASGDAPPAVELRVPGRPPLVISGPFGGGLAGLLIPGGG